MTYYKYPDTDRKYLSAIGMNVEYGIVQNDFPLHTHDFYEAFVIVSGSATHVVGEWQYPLSRGDMFVIKGDEVHGFRDVKDMNIINLMYNSHFLEQARTELRMIPGFSLFFLVEPQIRQRQKYPSSMKLSDRTLDYVVMMSEFICEQQDRDDPALYPVLRMNFLALFSYLATQYDAHRDAEQQVSVLTQALLYMELHLSEPIKLEDIAAGVFLSTRQLERIFQKYYGETPMRYLRNMRLKHAFSLLTQQRESIADAAEKSGFSDVSYFNRVFRMTYGMTPGAVQEHFLEVN